MTTYNDGSPPDPEPYQTATSKRPKNYTLREKLDSILHLNGCQQRTAGYNEAKDGKDLDTDDVERLEEVTLNEVLALVEEHTARAVQDNHANISYNPYVDTFHYWDVCVNKPEVKAGLTFYEVTRPISFATDKDGEVMHIEVKNLHTGAVQLTPKPEENV
jgi:hypothetical protein